MIYWEVILALAVIQGLTEFLPISSSAHLVLVQNWAQMEGDVNLILDVFLHAATLFAVIIYFRKRILELFAGFFKFSFRPQQATPSEKIAAFEAYGLVLATLPILAVGFLLKDFVKQWLHNPSILAYASIIFGIVLGLSFWFNKKQKAKVASLSRKINLKSAVIIGLTQVLALIPGASRAGVTLTAGLFLKIQSQKAAEFAMLLSIPTILGALALTLFDLISLNSPLNNIEFSLWLMLGACLLAFIVAFLTIEVFLKLIQNVGIWPFVIYRLGLGILILLLF